MPQNLDFIKNKISAIAKMHQISKAEALNTMEKIKTDKLLINCKYFTIDNEDEEDDCHLGICEQYWGDLHYPVNGISPIPFPLYHPDCECFTVYYGVGNIEISDSKNIELKNKLYNLQLQIIQIQENYLEKLSQILTKYYNVIDKEEPELFEPIEKDNNIKKENKKIKQFWGSTKNNIINLLLDMLEEVYELTISTIKNIYGDDFEYPTSEVEFYHKDGKTIDERLDRWFNPYK